MELSDEEIDHCLAETLCAIAKRKGLEWNEIRTDIAAHNTLRREYARAILAAHEAKKQQDRAALASQAQPVPQAIESLVSALAESRGWMRDYSRAIVEAAIEREQPDSFHQAQPSGCAATAGEEDRRMAFCPACFVEVTPEQAGQQTLDARRYRWLRDEENGDSDLCPFVAGDTLDAAIDAAMKSTAPGSADNAVRPTDEKESCVPVSALPQGWVAVPIEPTPAMLMAASDGYKRASQSLASFFPDRRAYAAMLAALPPPPVDQGEQQ